jgi:hypothetical protein
MGKPPQTPVVNSLDAWTPLLLLSLFLLSEFHSSMLSVNFFRQTPHLLRLALFAEDHLQGDEHHCHAKDLRQDGV